MTRADYGSSLTGYRFRIGVCLLIGVCSVIALALQGVEDKSSAQAFQPAEVAQQGLLNPMGWREATPGYQYTFPRDHGSHPDYRTEWWYYTGNVQTREGRTFGYQLTFFRTGITPQPLLESRWAVRDLYMAHWAISDLEEEQFLFFDRLNRAGVGWAGAATDRYRVWNEDWEARLEDSMHRLQAREGDYALDLRLAPVKAAVIHGDNGISRKGAAAINASHYYSLTRLQATGTITVAGKVFEVAGLSWMDHEFGTSFLVAEQIGWDWFSIQLDDGRELMVFRIRRADGSIDEHSSGTLIEIDGRAIHLPLGELRLAPGDEWQSPTSGARYPVVWQIEAPRYDLHLQVRAAFAAQELETNESTGVTYWEGSIRVEGITNESGKRSTSGRGYLEMTGYSGQNMGKILGGE